MIGGALNPRFPDIISRVVMAVDVAGGRIARIAPLPEAVSRPAVATAPKSLIVCGGTSNAIPMPHCQVYSLNGHVYVVCFHSLCFLIKRWLGFGQSIIYLKAFHLL